MYTINFLTEAINDIENAGNWYDEQQLGLGKKFTENILTAIEKLPSDKVSNGPIYRGLSRILIKRFPYVVYYRKLLDSRVIIIFGVLHIKQNRSHLDKRV